MAYVKAIADKVGADNGSSFSGQISWIVALFLSAWGTAAWIADFDPVASISASASSKDDDAASFDARFLQGSMPDPSSNFVTPLTLVQSAPPELEIKIEQAKGRLAQKLQSKDWRAALVDEAAPSITPSITSSISAAVPLPRSRPVEANLALNNSASITQADNRTLLQKLSDLLPGRIKLASLAPDGGLFREGPDLASLGYDNLTAVYDISARAVYMPNGSKLEAHSGFGSLMDDPAHVSERNVGATPPNVYDLKPRERLFHGVQALRMIPVGDNDTLGRSGLLAHSYMLGSNGDSNGCVSIKDYDKFLKAFQNGEIKRLVVVPSLSAGLSTSRRSISQS
jgi:Tlde1 domain